MACFRSSFWGKFPETRRRAAGFLAFTRLQGQEIGNPKIGGARDVPKLRPPSGGWCQAAGCARRNVGVPVICLNVYTTPTAAGFKIVGTGVSQNDCRSMFV